jgi:hypothetical protein
MSKKTKVHCLVLEPAWPGPIIYTTFYTHYNSGGSKFVWQHVARIHLDQEEKPIKMDKRETMAWADDIVDHEDNTALWPDWTTFVTPLGESTFTVPVV